LDVKVFGGKSGLFRGPGDDGLDLLFLEHGVDFGYEIANCSGFFEFSEVFLLC
jgi:hypothetical protein